MKNTICKYLVILSVLYTSCVNRQTQRHSETDTLVEVTQSDKRVAVKEGKNLDINDSVLFHFKDIYRFENSESKILLFIKRGSIDKRYDEPKDLLFRLDILYKNDGKIKYTLEGKAKLVGQNESFIDSEDSTFYEAADYEFKNNACDVNIRMDVENFEACVISNECDQLKVLLSKFPPRVVLKKFSIPAQK